MNKERAMVLLYNAIVLLQEHGYSNDELIEELGITEEELDEVFEGEEYDDFDDEEYLD